MSIDPTLFELSKELLFEFESLVHVEYMVGGGSERFPSFPLVIAECTTLSLPKIM